MRKKAFLIKKLKKPQYFFSFIGAQRLSEACFLLHKATMTKNIQQIHAFYEKTLKDAKILKQYLAKILEKAPDTTEIDAYSKKMLITCK